MKNGKESMDIGVAREQSLIGMFIALCGEANVDTSQEDKESESDVYVYGNPVSIKTYKSKNTAGYKVKWTSDDLKAQEVVDTYVPTVDRLVVQVNWGGHGHFAYINKSIQSEIFLSLGVERYLNYKPGTNHRGISVTMDAAKMMIAHKDTNCFLIEWGLPASPADVYRYWAKEWSQK